MFSKICNTKYIDTINEKQRYRDLCNIHGILTIIKKKKVIRKKKNRQR